MKARFKWLRQRSIKVNILLLLSIIITAAVVSLTLIAVNLTESQGLSAQQISSEALTSQAREYLLQLTLSSAKENDLAFDQIKKDAQQLADFAASIFENPSAFDTARYWDASTQLFQGPDGQFLNPPEDKSSVFVPNFQELNQDVIRDAELSAYLDLVFESLMVNHPETEAIYFATSRDVIRYYPNVNLGMVVPPDFRAQNRVWYAGSLAPLNPDGLAWWTPPYVDATGLGLVTTAAAPAYDKDQNLVGVVGFDVTLNELISRIEAARLLKTGYSFLIDGSGKAIALPPQGYTHILGRPQGTDEINIDLTKSQTGFAGIIAKMVRGGSGVETIRMDGKDLFVAYAPLPSTGWSLGSVVESLEITQSAAILQREFEKNTYFLLYNRVLPISLAIFIFVILLGLIVTNRITHPIQQLTAAAQKIHEGTWNVNLPLKEKNEIGFLAHTFQEMTHQIHTMVRDLEQKVNERTRELEMRSNQLQVAAEIAREATAVRELHTLLSHTVHLVKDRFDFIYAGIFLLDKRKEYAYLKGATGVGAREMLASGYKLRVGEDEIVGNVTESGKPQIRNKHINGDTPPASLSEMALPLTVDNQVIGALHVKREHPETFTEEDIHILQLMADQLAIAIENLRLYQEAQENLDKLNAMYDGYSQEAWKHIEKSKKIKGFIYEPAGVKPIFSQNGGSRAVSNYEDENAIIIPLIIRGRTIGELEVWPQNDMIEHNEIQLLQAVGERISQALESARLFEESQARTAREQTLNLISASFTHSLDIDTLLKTAVREMGLLPNVAEVTVHLEQPDNIRTEEARPDGLINPDEDKSDAVRHDE
jgi:GAF domain-containing protein